VTGRPNKAAVEERRSRVAQLYKGGATQTQIAKSLNVSVATVNTDLTEIFEGWRATQQASIADAATVDLMRVDDLLLALTPGARSGDTAAVRAYQSLLEHRAKIYGYFAPTRSDTHVSGHVRSGPDIGEMIQRINRAEEDEMIALGYEPGSTEALMARTRAEKAYQDALQRPVDPATPAMIGPPKPVPEAPLNLSAFQSSRAVERMTTQPDESESVEARAARLREAEREERRARPLHWD